MTYRYAVANRRGRIVTRTSRSWRARLSARLHPGGQVLAVPESPARKESARV